MRRALAILLAAAALAGAAGTAASSPAVAVLAVETEGVPEDARASFAASLEDGLRGAGFEVVPHARVEDAIDSGALPVGCVFGPCLRDAAKALGAELVLVARVTASGPSFTFVLSLVSTTTGAPVAQVSDACAVCTFDEASSAATLAAVELAAQAQGTLPAKGIEAPGRGDGGPAPRRPSGRARRLAWWMTGVGTAAIVVGAFLVGADRDEAGWATLGAGGGLGVAGLTLFVVRP